MMIAAILAVVLAGADVSPRDAAIDQWRVCLGAATDKLLDAKADAKESAATIADAAFGNCIDQEERVWDAMIRGIDVAAFPFMLDRLNHVRREFHDRIAARVMLRRYNIEAPKP